MSALRVARFSTVASGNAVPAVLLSGSLRHTRHISSLWGALQTPQSSLYAAPPVWNPAPQIPATLASPNANLCLLYSAVLPGSADPTPTPHPVLGLETAPKLEAGAPRGSPCFLPFAQKTLPCAAFNVQKHCLNAFLGFTVVCGRGVSVAVHPSRGPRAHIYDSSS